LTFPLTIGVVGALLVPQLAALGAIAALVTHGHESSSRRSKASQDGSRNLIAVVLVPAPEDRLFIVWLTSPRPRGWHAGGELSQQYCG